MHKEQSHKMTVCFFYSEELKNIELFQQVYLQVLINMSKKAKKNECVLFTSKKNCSRIFQIDDVQLSLVLKKTSCYSAATLDCDQLTTGQ